MSVFSSFTVYVAPVSDADLFAQVQNLHAFLFIKCQLNLALTQLLSCNEAERGKKNQNQKEGNEMGNRGESAGCYDSDLTMELLEVGN